MEIKVIGSGCDRCEKVYSLVTKCVAEGGMDATIEKVEDLIEIVKLGVMSVPAIMIDGKVVMAGQVPSEKQVKSYLEGK